MKKFFLIFLVLAGGFSTLYSNQYITDIWDNTVEIDFSVKNKNVYFGKQKIDRLDYSTFKEINEHYIKDNNRIYYFFVSHIITEILDNEKIEYRNIFESSNKNDNQIYEVEGRIIKLVGADPNNYKVKGPYLFSNNYVFNEGQIVSFNKNKFFTVDQKTLSIVYQRCQSLLEDTTCDIIIKDKNKSYILLDGTGDESITDDNGYTAGRIKKTKVYEIKNIDESFWEKLAMMYEDNYKTDIFKDLLKRAKRII